MFTLTPLPAPLPALEPLPDGARRVRVDDAHGYPCRRCLRDAEPGETVVLLSYDPFVGSGSPYRQPGPVYVHELPCAPDARPDGELPDQLTRRLLSVRSFDGRALMRDATVTPGVGLARVASAMLTDPKVAYLHVHNAGPGCFAVRIDRV